MSQDQNALFRSPAVMHMTMDSTTYKKELDNSLDRIERQLKDQMAYQIIDIRSPSSEALKHEFTHIRLTNPSKESKESHRTYTGGNQNFLYQPFKNHSSQPQLFMQNKLD
jgi:sensor domain CHASE-containing protein